MEQHIIAPLSGTVISVVVGQGSTVLGGKAIIVIESMKMFHDIVAPFDCLITNIETAQGDTINIGDIIATLTPAQIEPASSEQNGSNQGPDLDAIPPSLGELIARKAMGLDENRTSAIAKRTSIGRKSARENITQLIDPDSLIEYGPLVIAAQRRRRPVEELIERTPADGLVGGIASVNGDLFDNNASQVIVMSYDYTVMAGTQGAQNHRKKDKLFELAAKLKTPVVLFAEGGGGRPGDTDVLGVSGLDCLAFGWFAQLSALVPLVGIVSGYCFAGNAALLGCCDVIIATPDSNIAMAGPAMIEGGGLGIFEAKEVGPVSDQQPNGVIDIVAKDETNAVDLAKKYLAFFQGEFKDWQAPDPRLARHAIPQDRKRVYNLTQLVESIFDIDSVLELRAGFGQAMFTALARVEGKPVGIIGNNPAHLSGAIDSPAADKASRFMQLCDSFDIPIVSLCDTPGMMVGPEIERSALVRHCSRLFVTGANLSVPFVCIVTRKAYGLGSQAMMGGSTKAPLATLAWPTAEFGPMGFEGAAKLGYKAELEAIADPTQRQQRLDAIVDKMYEHGKAINAASHFEIDDVIDPSDTRRWIRTLITKSAHSTLRTGKKRPNIDTW